MKKSMLLVIFSLMLAFGATYAMAEADLPVTPGNSQFQDEEIIMESYGGPEDDNEGDPDGYKEGWDSDGSLNGSLNLDGYDLAWGEVINLWMLLSLHSPF